MNRLRKLFHRRHDFQPFQLEEDFLPETVGQGEAPRLRTEGPRVWYVGFRCVACGEPGFKQGPLL